ncbi:MAG: hypothetical protein IJ349_11135 [Clostridia bacterium]|nr:hypothetical protein [Clostridia bacterium]
MSNIIEELFYVNLEPQELTTEITPKLKKRLNELVKKEEELSSKPTEEEKSCSQIMQVHTMSFQVSAFLTVLFRVSGSVRDLRMILL